MALFLTPGSHEERVAAVVVHWIDLVRRSGNPRYTETWLPSNADLCKSALLARLLEGKEAHPLPPPRCYSYPWHSLLDDGEARLNDQAVSEPFVGSEDQGLDPGQLYVDVCRDVWKVLSVGLDSDSTHYTLSYYGDDRWELFPQGPDEESPEAAWTLRRTKD